MILVNKMCRWVQSFSLPTVSSFHSLTMVGENRPTASDNKENSFVFFFSPLCETFCKLGFYHHHGLCLGCQLLCCNVFFLTLLSFFSKSEFRFSWTFVLFSPDLLFILLCKRNMGGVVVISLSIDNFLFALHLTYWKKLFLSY